jgi:hypothetical protein
MSLADRLASLQERIRKAQVKVEKEKAQANEKTLSAFLAAGSSMLGALFGRKLASTANVTRAASAMRAGGRVMRERQDITDANESVEALQQQLADLEAEVQAETTKVQDGLQPDALTLESLQISPKKSEINVSGVALVWQPWIVRMDGAVESGT